MRGFGGPLCEWLWLLKILCPRIFHLLREPSLAFALRIASKVSFQVKYWTHPLAISAAAVAAVFSDSLSLLRTYYCTLYQKLNWTNNSPSRLFNAAPQRSSSEGSIVPIVVVVVVVFVVVFVVADVGSFPLVNTLWPFLYLSFLRIKRQSSSLSIEFISREYNSQLLLLSTVRGYEEKREKLSLELSYLWMPPETFGTSDILRDFSILFSYIQNKRFIYRKR